MRPISDVVGQDLLWLQRGRGDGWELGPEHELRVSDDHELRVGDDIVARLRFRGRLPSEAEVDRHHWTFDYVKRDRAGAQGPPGQRVLRNLLILLGDGGTSSRSLSFWLHHLLVVKEEESRVVAFFGRRGPRGGTLEFRDGHQLRLERWWRPFGWSEWIWQDETQQLLHFKERWSKHKVAFDVPPSAPEFSQMPLLVVIGWYCILQSWEGNRAPVEG